MFRKLLASSIFSVVKTTHFGCTLQLGNRRVVVTFGLIDGWQDADGWELRKINIYEFHSSSEIYALGPCALCIEKRIAFNDNADVTQQVQSGSGYLADRTSEDPLSVN